MNSINKLDNRAYIVGCQRSGTTLLRLILECHSRIYCFDETRAYRVLAAGHHPKLTEEVLAVFKIPRWTEQLDLPVLSDPGLEEKAQRFYRPPQKILYMLRNVGDVIVSMLKLKSADRSWLEIWGTQILEEKFRHDPAFRATYEDEFSKLRSARYPLCAAGALYWKYKTLPFFRYQAKGYPLLGISYEKLVTDPQPVLESICNFLGIRWEPSLYRHETANHGEILGGVTVGGTDPRRPIHSESVGQSGAVFTPDQFEEIHSIVGDLPLRLSAAVRGNEVG